MIRRRTVALWPRGPTTKNCWVNHFYYVNYRSLCRACWDSQYPTMTDPLGWGAKHSPVGFRPLGIVLSDPLRIVGAEYTAPAFDAVQNELRMCDRPLTVCHLAACECGMSVKTQRSARGRGNLFICLAPNTQQSLRKIWLPKQDSNLRPFD